MSQEEREGLSKNLFRRKASKEMQLAKTGRTVTNKKILPILNLKAIKLEDSSNSQLLQRTKRDYMMNKSGAVSPIIPPTESVTSIKILNQSLISGKKILSKQLLVKKIHRNFMIQKYKNTLSATKKELKPINPFFTLPLKVNIGTPESNTAKDKNEMLTPGKISNFLRKSNKSTLLNKPVVLPENLIRK